MVAISNFDAVIGRQLARHSPEAIRQRHIIMARTGLAQRRTGKSPVKIEVDGHPALTEAEVRPFGVIAYVMRPLLLAQAARFAKATAKAISPVRSGRYREGWIILADGAEVGEDEIPANAIELTIVDSVPYARKIELFGARLLGVPPGIVERVKEFTLQRYPADILARIEYVPLAGGYVLKSGGEMTYPALTLRARNQT